MVLILAGVKENIFLATGTIAGTSFAHRTISSVLLDKIEKQESANFWYKIGNAFLICSGWTIATGIGISVAGDFAEEDLSLDMMGVSSKSLIYDEPIN